MSRDLFQSAITKMSLFQRERGAQQLLNAIATITGIPPTRLYQAERQIAATRSLLPLEQLFVDPAVPKANKLRYKIGMAKLCRNGQMPSEQGVHLAVAVETVRGLIQAEFKIFIRQPRGQGALGQQVSVTGAYRITSQNRTKTYRRNLVLSSQTPLNHYQPPDFAPAA